jgi:predicted dehydrogenase
VVLTKASNLQRVLVAGTGSIGRRHIKNLRALRPQLQFALLRDGGRQDEFSAALHAPVFSKLDEVLAWQPQLAVVATPSDRHAELIFGLLDAGIASFIEKPVVIQAEALQALRQRVDRPLPPTQIGCVLRFLPSLRRLRELVAAGSLGRVVRAGFEVGQWLPDWRPHQDYRESYSASRARGGGVVFDLVHEIDLACWLFGPAELLGAWGGHSSSLEIESEDTALLALLGGQGELISVQLDYVSRVLVRRLHVVGDVASAVWDLPERSLRVLRSGLAVQCYADGFEMGEAYVDAMNELVLAVETGTPTSLPLAAGLQATQIAIDANTRIRRSL